MVTEVTTQSAFLAWGRNTVWVVVIKRNGLVISQHAMKCSRFFVRYHRIGVEFFFTKNKDFLSNETKIFECYEKA